MHADSSARETQKLERRQSIQRELRPMRSLRVFTRLSQLLLRRGHLRKCPLTTQTLHQTMSLPPQAGLACTDPQSAKRITPVGTLQGRPTIAVRRRVLTTQAWGARMRCTGLLEIEAIHFTQAFLSVPLGLHLAHLHHGVAEMSSHRP